MFWGTTVGLPGRCLPIWRATTRPQTSSAPPGPVPMIICTFLPARLGACAAAGAVNAASAATAAVILILAMNLSTHSDQLTATEVVGEPRLDLGIGEASVCPIRRARTSVPPAGASGTIRRTGRDG